MAKVRMNCGVAPEGCAVSLFSVYNTSCNELLVLARDHGTALRIAGSANHFYSLGSFRKDSNYPRADEVKKPFGRVSDYWELIQQAASERMEGTVHLDDGRLAIGQQVVAP